MKVMVHAAGNDGCRLYRVSLPIKALSDPNVKEDFKKHAYRPVGYKTIAGDQVHYLEKPSDADVIVFQRPLKRINYEIIRVLQEVHGKTVIVETDDDFHSLPLKHPTRAEVDPITNPLRNKEWLKRACERADLVTVTTPALAQRYGSHGRVAILPNFVPANYLDFKAKPHKGIRVGWPGRTDTHIDDLKVTKGAVAAAIKDNGALLHVVGLGNDVGRQLGAGKVDYVSGIVSLEQYPREIAKFDIGICPLAPNTFNESKSFLKPLEMIACGVPCVMSPSADYLRLNEKYGIGLIANTPDEWYGLVSELIRNEPMRKELAEAGRAVIREHLLIENNAHLWRSAWLRAVEYRNTRHAA